MNWIPHVSSTYFAIAAVCCAAGPILIHLLTRRRFRVVEWAAMDFLRAALEQQHRKLRLRDLLLLLLRTAAVLLFGLALARPYFTANGSSIDGNGPRHLIVLLDNSLSMGYHQLGTTRFACAKEQAGNLIESLPDGSQVTILGTRGKRNVGHGPIRRKSDAIDQLANMDFVDGMSTIEDVVSMARTAVGTAAPLPDQIVYFTDLQANNWPADVGAQALVEIPTFHIHDMSDPNWENTWVADLRLRDDIVDLDVPATVFVTIGHHGTASRHVQVSLAVNAQVVASRNIELSPGHSPRQLTFKCSFADAPAEPGSATFVPLKVSLTPDRLEQDDHRTLLVPVVTSLPVVFVDQYTDEEEDPRLGRLGETRPLRQLLAPQAARAAPRRLVDVQHVTIADVNRDLLAPARLVVVAGIADPSPAIELLRQYVEQGGPLIVAAGGQFAPRTWNRVAGRQATDLLPGHLADQPLGTTPDELGDKLLQPFSLLTADLTSYPLLQLPGLSAEELRELYREPLFFKAVVLQLPASQGLSGKRLTNGSNRVSSPATWLAWTPPNEPNPSSAARDRGDTVAKRAAEICASFADAQGTPFLVRHPLGRGQVLFASTSILPTWNNLAQTNAIVLWDHVMRSLIRSTLPIRNFLPQDLLPITVPTAVRAERMRLQRPNDPGLRETVAVGFIGKNQHGVVIPDVWQRGIYRLTSAVPSKSLNGVITPKWELDLAVNGDARESDLSPLTTDEIEKTIVGTGHGRLFDGQSLAQLENSDLGSAIWWWLIVLVLVAMVTELIILTLSSRAVRVVNETENAQNIPTFDESPA